MRLRSACLRPDDRAHRRIGIGARSQYAHGHGNQHRHRILFFLGNLAGQVVLRDMADFVRNHAGQFRFRLCRQNRSRIDADVAAKHSECIDCIVADGKEIKPARRITAGFNQTTPQAIQVIADFRILDIRRLALSDFIHDALADAALDLRRKIGARRLAQFRQTVCLRKRGRRQRQEQRQKTARTLPKQPGRTRWNAGAGERLHDVMRGGRDAENRFHGSVSMAQK